MIVVDNDVISYFWLELASGRSETARRARRKDAEWVAPPLWRSEFRNVLRRYMQIGLMTYSEALWFAEKAERDLRRHEYEVQTPDVLKLVEQTGHAAYDCQYVTLAQSLGVPLVTGDQPIVEAFPDTAVLLEDFAG